MLLMAGVMAVTDQRTRRPAGVAHRPLVGVP